MERIEKLKNFLADNPGDSFLMHALALEYVKVKDDGSAESLFNELLMQHPEYVGSYYHLGKLLERRGAEDAAVKIYENGMEKAKEAKDNHALNELKMAWEDLTL